MNVQGLQIIVNRCAIIHMEHTTVLVILDTGWPLIIGLAMVGICTKLNRQSQYSCNNCHYLEIDECTEEMSGCSQSCVNTAGSYYCSCDTGFEIDVDQHTCHGELSSMHTTLYNTTLFFKIPMNVTVITEAANTIV